MKKYIAIVPVVLGLMLVVSLFTPTRVAHAQVGRPCNVGLWSQGVYDQYSNCVQNTTSTTPSSPIGSFSIFFCDNRGIAGTVDIVNSPNIQTFNFAACAYPTIQYSDFIKLNTNDKIDIICNGVVSNTFTGPGVFVADLSTKSCGGNNWWDAISLSIVSTVPVPILTSSSYSSPNVTVQGTGMSDTSNTFLVTTSNGTTQTISNIGGCGSGSCNVPLPAGMAAGTYTIKVQPSGASSYSNSVSFTITPIAPSNLTAATTTTPGQVALSWKNNSTTQTGVDIERAISGES